MHFLGSSGLAEGRDVPEVHPGSIPMDALQPCVRLITFLAF